MSLLRSELGRLAKSKRVPALATAAFVDGEVRELATVGKRKIDAEVAVSDDDKWHVGSCTKPMTATVAGILVDQGKIDWNTRIIEVFEDCKYHQTSPGAATRNHWHRSCDCGHLRLFSLRALVRFAGNDYIRHCDSEGEGAITGWARTEWVGRARICLLLEIGE